MIRTVLATAIVVGVTAAAVAQSDPIETRQKLMKSNGKELSLVNKMVRGEEPFDAAKAKAAFEDWADSAKKLPALFASPPPAGAKTRALPKIWQDKADFEAKLTAFAKVVADNEDKAQTLEGLTSALREVSKACSDCHEPYRRPRNRG
jgi:cytochrome c556